MFTEKLNNQLFLVDAVAKAQSILDQYKDKKIRVAYSGGSDSDTMMFFLREVGYDVHAVFYDTGLEYQATWDQVNYMKTMFTVDTIKVHTPIPTSNKKYGSPFLSKRVSEFLNRMQQHKFNFSVDGNLSVDDLMIMYPNLKSALYWWTNSNQSKRLNVSWNGGLKEFIISNPPQFKIANKCCEGAKKLPIKHYAKENSVDLMTLGLRRSENGARGAQYSNCFVAKKKHIYDMYFPLFWWSDADKKLFIDEMKIKTSAAYSEYGLKRTGCAGCPFGRDFEHELSVIHTFEPKLEKGINNIFASSFSYTRAYKEFVKTF